MNFHEIFMLTNWNKTLKGIFDMKLIWNSKKTLVNCMERTQKELVLLIVNMNESSAISVNSQLRLVLKIWYRKTIKKQSKNAENLHDMSHISWFKTYKNLT